MKSGFLFLVGLVLSASVFSARAQASDLIVDTCIDGDGAIQSASFDGLIVPAAFSDDGSFASRQFAKQSFMGMSCQQIKTAKEALALAGATILPARSLVKMMNAGPAFAAAIEAAGLANPAVLSVTAVGATGLIVVYYVLKQTVDECEREDREDFKQEIFQELESRYGIHASSSQDIQFKSR